MVFGLRLGLPSRKSSVSEAPPESGPTTATPGLKSGLTVNEFVAKTKKSREKGLEPTKPELISYAKYLGIDPVIDGDLMWIADEALRAPLPCEWTEHHDSAERIFYYNVDTHESSWVHPLEQLHRDIYKSITNFRGGSLGKEDQMHELDTLRRKVEESEREAHKELQSWTEHTDDQGQKFYYHRSSQRSVWTDPRPVRCHTLYLQMKALRVLGKHCGQVVSPRNPERLVPEKCVPMSSLAPTRAAHGDEKPHALKSPGRGKSPSAADHKVGKKSKKDKAKHRGPKSQSGMGLDDSACMEMKRSGSMDFKKPMMLDLKRPTTEETRGMLAASPSLPLLNSGSPAGDLQRDGFPMGRPRVRAGIRLEPIRASAAC